MAIAPVAHAQPDCRRGVDHKVGCGLQYRPEYQFNEHERGRPHPQAVWRGNDGWVLPALLIGGLIAVEANRPAPIVEQPLYIQQPNYLPQAPYGYRYINAFDPACNCNKVVLVPN